MSSPGDQNNGDAVSPPEQVPIEGLNFSEFQRRARRTRVFRVQWSDGTDPRTELARHYLAEGLTAQVGEMAGRLKKKLRDGEDYTRLQEEMARLIGHALWYIASLADEMELDLNQIAIENAVFNERRWPHEADDNPPIRDFDEGFPEEQHLPRRLVTQFETQVIEGLKKTFVWVYPNFPDLSAKIPFGDAIDDNSPVEDHYRHHDVYHLAYLAYLGWSPVVRKLLECKRKGDPDIDRIEDGARARDLEEATTAFIFAYVSGQNYLSTSDNIDTSVLATVCKLVRALEVHVCFEKEWEMAIINATRVLRDLVANEGGWVEVDRTAKSVTYLGKETPAGASQ